MTDAIGDADRWGDCPGLNAVIRAVVRKGERVHGDELVGFRDGWRGVIEDDVVPARRRARSGHPAPWRHGPRHRRATKPFQSTTAWRRAAVASSGTI